MPVIATNTAANSAVAYLNINSMQESSALSKLASGSRITQASDDAAGLAIATSINSDVSVLQQAATNASQATSILQTADGGASNISDILTRMKSLASESASGTVTSASRSYINSEFSQLASQVDSIASGTAYGGQSLLNGSAFNASATVPATVVGTNAFTSATDLSAKTLTVNGTSIDLTGYTAGAKTAAQLVADINSTLSAASSTISASQTGGIITFTNSSDTGTVTLAGTAAATLGLSTAATSATTQTVGVNVLVGATASDTVTMTMQDLTATTLGVNALDVSTQTGATSAMTALDTALTTVASARASFGAQESRFNFSANSISTQTQNLQAASSAISDVDVASEQSTLSSAEVKTQAAVSAEVAANQMPQYLLKLLG